MPIDAVRRRLIARELATAGLDGLLCSLPANVLMLSGYWPVVGTALALASADGKVAIVVPEDEYDLVDEERIDASQLFPSGTLKRLARTIDLVREPLAAAARAIGLAGGRIGWEASSASTPASYAATHLYRSSLAQLLRECLAAEPVGAREVIARLRAIKSPAEIARIRQAAAAAGDAYEEGRRRLRAGLREIDAASELRASLFREPVCEGVAKRSEAFVFCMSGVRAAHAFGSHARSTAELMKRGDCVLVHCNSSVDGYWTDLTRTWPVEASSSLYDSMMEAIAAAREAAFSAIRPGALGRDVDAAARRVIDEHGFGGRFRHATGHGIGFAAIDHEAVPRLHPCSDDRLEPGMVFNVEPGIYLDDCGARHCDMVAIGDDGSIELLSPFLPPASSAWPLPVVQAARRSR